jgi:hypothetical protein
MRPFFEFGYGALLGPCKNCVSLTSIRGDWSSFQLAIIRHRLDLMCTDFAPSAKIVVKFGNRALDASKEFVKETMVGRSKNIFKNILLNSNEKNYNFDLHWAIVGATER